MTRSVYDVARRIFHALLLCGAVAAVGCGEAATVIEVRTDLDVPRELDGICLAVSDRSASGGEFGRFYPLVAADSEPQPGEVAGLPQTLTVEPGSATGAMARVRGYLGGVEQRRAQRSFDFSGSSEVSLQLQRCPGGDGGAPLRADAVDAAGDARIAVSAGRGGSVLVVVAGNAAAAYRAGVDGFSAAELVLPEAPAVAPTAVLAFDADGDCDDDLLLLQPVAPPTLWRRDAAGFVADDGAFAGAGLSAERAAAAADVDGDGDIDLVFGRDSQLRLVRNDGAGVFRADSPAIPGTVATDVTALVFGDIDLDGNVDLIVGQGDATAAPSFVLRNDPAGAGFFEVAAAALPDLPLRVRALALLDVNGDGALDLISAGISSNVRVYINRGDGRLEDRSFITLPPVDAADAETVVAGDWDSDCLPDVVIGLSGDALAPLSWRGDGAGALVAESLQVTTGSRLLLADVDDDGDGDLLVANGSSVVWLRRQP